MRIAVIDTYTMAGVRALNCALIAVDYSKVQLAVMNDKDLADYVLSHPVTPVNFEVDNKERVINECSGVFDRLASKSGVSPCVILAEMRTATRLLGYIVLSKNGTVARVRRDDLYRTCAEAKNKGFSYVQNGIYRDADGVKSISCYPYRPFPVYTIESAKKPVAVSAPTQKAAKEPKAVAYTKAQLTELNSAKEKGVDTACIENPSLSPEQMHILWIAKRNGRAVELFAFPKYSPDTMRFFAKTVVSRKMYKTFYDMFNAEYTADQVEQLYYGISEGLDYAQYANPSMSAKRMAEKRIELSNEMYRVLVEKTDRYSMKYKDSGIDAFYASRAAVKA